jgi:hypothetical protein
VKMKKPVVVHKNGKTEGETNDAYEDEEVEYVLDDDDDEEN